MIKNLLCRIWVCIFAISFLFSGCAKEEEKTEISIVQVTCGGMSGSGVVYECSEDALIIVTAGHVLEQYAQGQPVYVLAGESSLVAYSCNISRTSEVAFINLSMEDIAKEERENWKAVLVDKAQFDALAAGDSVFFRTAADVGDGVASGEDVTEPVIIEPWIYVEDFAQYMMLVKGGSTPGMSGGGLFDAEGHFIGILCGVNEKNETAVVPLSIIQAEYLQHY